MVNPLERGHIAYRTDDIEAFMAHLDTQGVLCSGWGSDAVQGWHRVFFYNPEGNMIEVHQLVGTGSYWIYECCQTNSNWPFQPLAAIKLSWVINPAC